MCGVLTRGVGVFVQGCVCARKVCVVSVQGGFVCVCVSVQGVSVFFCASGVCVGVCLCKGYVYECARVCARCVVNRTPQMTRFRDASVQ